MYQKVHLDKFWRLVNESWVWFHGFAVAIMVANGVWWKDDMMAFMFGYGFGTLFFVTQIFGLPFWKNISPYWRILPAGGWLLFAILLVVCNDEISNHYLMTLVVIPAGQWGCAFLTWLVLYAFAVCLPKR